MHITKTNKERGEKVVIEAPEGAIVRPRGEHRTKAKHISTGYKIECVACGGEHDLDIAGPYWTPKLSFVCDKYGACINWPSKKAQALFRSKIKGNWSPEHIEKLMERMYEENASIRGKQERRRKKTDPEHAKKRAGEMKSFIEKLADGTYPKKKSAEAVKPPTTKPSIKLDRGLLDALKEAVT